MQEPSIGAYSSISNLVRGFDNKVLQAAFKVPEDLIESITEGTKAPAIVHAVPTKETTFWELEARFLKVFLGGKGGMAFNKKKKKTRTFNIIDADPDFENCNGRSLTVTKRNFHLLKDSSLGLFMVNLTKVSELCPACCFLGILESKHSNTLFFLTGLDDGAPLESNGNGDSSSVARARDGSGGLF